MWNCKYISDYIDLIKSNKVEHCKKQELMIENIVLPVLERDDVYIDNEAIEKGLALQKYIVSWVYFPTKIF